MEGHLRNSVRVCGGVSPERDAAHDAYSGAAGQQPLNELKPARSGSASTLKQINNQDDDSNYEQ